MKSLVMSKARSSIAALAAIALAIALCLCFTGCAGSNQGASTDKKLHAGSTTYFFAESMDPASEWDSWYLSYYGIVENLCKVNNDLTPEPWLAKSVEQVDDYTWKIVLNDNIKFSNGEACDANAVKAAWERTYAENSRAAETLKYDELTADGNILTIKTSEKLPSLPNTLCDPLLCVYYVGDGVDYANDTPATGPYKKVDFKAEDHITMEPNSDYWNGTPKISEVTLTNFADDNSLTMAMQNGEIDAIAMPSASARKVLSDENKYTITSRVSSRGDFIRMNMDHPVIKNDAIREAIAYCIDRDSYASVICEGSSVASWGVYSSTLPFGGTEGLDVKVSSFDPEAAKGVLDAAGITDSNGDGVRELNGSPVELSLYTCTKYERFVQLADDMQSKLGEVGIKINIVPTDYYLEDAETFAKDDPDMCFDSAAMAPTGNQAYFANIQFATGASNNFGHYSNAKVDELIAELDGTYGENERNEIARQIAQQVLNDTSFIFFANPEAVVVSANSVSGLDAAPSEYYFVTVDTDVK